MQKGIIQNFKTIAWLTSLSLILSSLVACQPSATPAAQVATIAPATATAPPAPTATATATPLPSPTASPSPTTTPTVTSSPTPLHPRAIDNLRQQSYPGSDLVIVEALSPGATYSRALASYQSDGLTIYGLLTVPNDPAPATGWPGIIFNHGYIPPTVYQTGERYVAYVDAFARANYVVFMPDYRGHGNSEGEPSAGYGSTEYLSDVLNSLASLQRHPAVDPNQMGMWGHSMGGGLTLRAMVTVNQIKAGVIWAGVIGPYGDIIHNWTPPEHPAARAWRNGLLTEYGAAADDSAFWEALSPTSYLDDIAPLQLHHGSADSHVPPAFSATVAEQMTATNRAVELFIYENDDHNLSQNLSTALQRSVEFFDQHLK